MSLVRPGGRACGTLRECYKLVDGASERLVGVRDCSAARVSAAAAAQIVQQPVVWPPTAGHAQLAAGAIETGRAAGEGVLGLARTDRPRRHVATRRGAGTTGCQHARTIGHAAMVRRSRTGHVVDMFTGRTERHVARALALGRLSPGGLRTVLGGGSKRQLVRTGFWRQMDNQRTAKSSMRKAGLHHKCILMAQSATCASVRRLSWHTHN